MGTRSHRRDPVVPGPPAAPDAQTSQGRSLMRTLRTAWWPRFLVAGVVLMAVGGALLSGWAQALVALGGAVVFVFALVVGWQGKTWDGTAFASHRCHTAAALLSRISDSAAGRAGLPDRSPGRRRVVATSAITLSYEGSRRERAELPDCVLVDCLSSNWVTCVPLSA